MLSSHVPSYVLTPGLEVIKLFFMLNSTEHEFFRLINVKMPTIVGILTLMSRKNCILGLSETEKKLNFSIFIHV